MEEATMPGIYTKVGSFLNWIRRVMKHSQTINNEVKVIAESN